jgi:NADPH-dependent 2,4-dienoyl-CoA reductase/sulfur reductase-like enzyme
MAETVERELEDNGVRIIGERVEEILGVDGQVSGIKINTKREINSDFIVLGTGVKPNSEIARDAEVELGSGVFFTVLSKKVSIAGCSQFRGVQDRSANAIKVDEHMKTNIPDVFAAGDCATARNYITNKDMYLPLRTTANKQGRVAGENAAGGNAKFRGTKVFALFIGKTGLTKEDALRNGFDPVEEVTEDITRASYYPDRITSGFGGIWLNLQMNPHCMLELESGNNPAVFHNEFRLLKK